MSYYQVIYIPELVDLIDQYLQIDEVVKFHKTFNISFSINFIKRIYNNDTKYSILCTKKKTRVHGNIFECQKCKLTYCAGCCNSSFYGCKSCGRKFCKDCNDNLT